MDFNQFDLATPAEVGADVVIKHPVTGEDTDIVITVVGKDSATYRNAAKRIAANKLPEESEAKEKDLTKRGAELLTSCIRAWSGMSDSDGNQIPFTHEFAVEVLSNTDFDSLAVQINAAIHDRTLYQKKSVKS